LITNANTLETDQIGLSDAKNLVFSRPNLVSGCRGFKQLAGTTSAGKQLFTNGEDRWLLNSTGLALYAGSDWGSVAACVPPSGSLMTASFSGDRNFFTTSTGVKAWENGALLPAGVPPALDIATSVTGTSGFLANGNKVSYTYVFSRQTSVRLLVGSPAFGIELTNSSGGTRNVALTMTIPSSITTSHQVQVYRTVQSTASNAEYYYVKSLSIAAGDITAGFLSFTDTILDTQLGAALYTNASQEGILAQNEPPPACKVLGSFQGTTFFANVSRPAEKLLKLLLTPSVNDTIAIAGVTFTAKAAETIASGFFDQSGTLENTARSLCRVINQYASSTSVYARYLGAGLIFLQGRALTVTSLTITPSVAATWDIQDGRPIEEKNKVYCSKPGEPDAVPSQNFATIAGVAAEVTAMVFTPVHIFICTSEGIFGSSEPYLPTAQIVVIDATLVVPNPFLVSPAEAGAYVLSREGLFKVTPQGSERLDYFLKNYEDILDFDALSVRGFMLNYTVDRNLIVALPQTDDAESDLTWWVFSTLVQEWTYMDRIDHSAIFYQGKLNSLQSDQTFVERKERNRSDFANREYAVVISSVADDVVELVDASEAIEGYSLVQGSYEGQILSIDGNFLTLDVSFPWDLSTATLLEPLEYRLETTEITVGDATLLKKFTEQTVLMQDAAFSNIRMDWKSDRSQLFQEVNAVGGTASGWGLPAWGIFPWGGFPGGPRPIRVLIPLNMQRGMWLQCGVRLKVAKQYFSFAGLHLNVYQTTTKIKT